MLYLRDGNHLTSEQEAAIEAALAELGLRVGEVREAILVSLPDPEAEARECQDVTSFDDALSHLRRPWWRRYIDRICRPFRR